MEVKRMAKIIKVVVFFTFFFSLSTCLAQASPDYAIEKISFQSQPDYTQIFLDVPRETGYIVKELSNPPRLLINLYPAKLFLSQREIKIEDQFVQRIRLSQDSDHVVKIVLDLSNPEYSWAVFPSEDSSQIIVEVRSPEKDVVRRLLRGQEEAFTFSFSPEKASRVKGKIRRIVLDPGHGGKDPGAIGPTGLKEKEVTLAIAKELARLLRREGLEVYLTREDDRFIPLDRRAEIANQLKGDIFLSIHANAGFSRKAGGIETFFNSRYSYGKGAEEVAARENAAFGSTATFKEVRAIVWDLIQDQYRAESNELSHSIQRYLVQATNLEDRGVKSARFYVLRGAAMPAALVEVGFISNPWEERLLKRDSFRKKVALGIFRGLMDYIREYQERVSG
ncbi:hypothetical protein DRJ00_01715 [Candidatus Aerophobetes bacterium]|uniref:MurNAc-LAA domain-containing protein n=1 Tax=Aerophobetes bacterium TaxID=2030807 RepID=A0A497E760_UNCAE|nr:MAG: hypothetical protein DRJ00_01715 [Candidatus Aerophobetes bacterium]